MRRSQHTISDYQPAEHRRFSPLVLIGVLGPVMLVLMAASVFLLPNMRSRAAGVNGDCTLIVPLHPLTAQGLATPYQLVATDAANGPCHEANKAQTAFVQGAVFDPVAATIAIYNPLVIDQGTQPAAVPVMPQLPNGAIVALWFGSNGNTLTLQDSNGSLQEGKCVNGIAGSIFGQFASCNAPAFFQAANQAIQAGKLVPPPLGMAKDGKTCPTVRDFAVVDQDQSDNVTTRYLVTAGGQTAQMTAANTAALQGTHPQANGSDNRLLDAFVDPAIGCTPWMAPDLADPGQMVPALPLNELQAAVYQAAPVALVPDGDPMVLVNNEPNRQKLLAYRAGVDQLMLADGRAGMPEVLDASTRTYCSHLREIGPTRMLLDAPWTIASPSPDPGAADSLLTFLEQRFVTSYEANGLNCTKLLDQADPIAVTIDANGVAINGTINGVANSK